jgi:hypothetical protein
MSTSDFFLLMSAVFVAPHAAPKQSFLAGVAFLMAWAVIKVWQF